MSTILLRLLIAAVLCCSSIAAANAQTHNKSQQQQLAKQAFQSALKNITTRRATLPENAGLSYVQTELDKKGNGKSSMYQPHGQQQGSWTELKQYGELLESNLTFEAPFLIEPSAFSTEHAELSNETESTWVFQIPNLVSVGLGGDETKKRQKQEQQIGNKLTSTLQTEVVIDKRSLQFVSLHIFAKAPFKPSILAKVEKFEVRIEFSEAWQEGPLISQSTSRSMQGKYGFFVRIDEFRTTTVSEIKQVQLR